ncbi:hypothetical protein FGIG_11711 [Fasciola gigantica]|uniref:Uncharacterized protein n=1 Tax=Fasciola gigantica TaxID=46835 RepID=A0A504YY30_FASGI|nr:hypothetical protein FGIG_11711 [Fasciola gigantica]
MVTRARDRYVSEWRKRKRMVTRARDRYVSEWRKRKRMIDIGIETDEDCGVQIPAN